MPPECFEAGRYLMSFHGKSANHHSARDQSTHTPARRMSRLEQRKLIHL
jgi:hypothetical protein